MIYYANKPHLGGSMIWYIPDCMNAECCLFVYLPLLSVSSYAICLCVSHPVQLSIHPQCLYICLPSQYVQLYFKGLSLCLSSHSATWRHQSWAGTPWPGASWSHCQFGLTTCSHSRDTVAPLGQSKSIEGEEEMTEHSYSWGVTDKAGPPNQHTTKNEKRMHLVTQSES